MSHPADLVTFTGEILNRKLHFLCSVTSKLDALMHKTHSGRGGGGVIFKKGGSSLNWGEEPSGNYGY